jgi:hypothetical protein
MSGTAPIDKYRQKAKEKFAGLKLLYTPDPDTKEPTPAASYWKLGTSFDTMIDFLDIVDSTGANEVARNVIKQFTLSLKEVGKPGPNEPSNPNQGYNSAWFDDFGWWTIAIQRALERPYFTEAKAKSDLENLMQNCWGRYTDNAPEVWNHRKPGTYDNCRPAVEGGVWNAYWEGTPVEWLGPRGNPNQLSGIQNTVTNALYLMAAQRLGVKDPRAKASAQKEFKFLDAWFDMDKDPLWWRPASNNTEALIRERVSHFFNGAGATEFQREWAWAGDQGLMLGGFVDRIELMGVSPDERKKLQGRAKDLLDGALGHMVKDGALQAWTTAPGGGPPNSDDYGTGRGIFWRNFLHAWKQNPGLRAIINSPEYRKLMTTSADAAANSLDPYFDGLTNDLATLTAAIAILS